MTIQVSSQASSQHKIRVQQPTISHLVQNVAAITFGAIIVFAVGFLPMEAVHNAAHDTRHALAFPCH